MVAGENGTKKQYFKLVCLEPFIHCVHVLLCQYLIQVTLTSPENVYASKSLTLKKHSGVFFKPGFCQTHSFSSY